MEGDICQLTLEFLTLVGPSFTTYIHHRGTDVWTELPPYADRVIISFVTTNHHQNQNNIYKT